MTKREETMYVGLEILGTKFNIQGKLDKYNSINVSCQSDFSLSQSSFIPNHILKMVAAHLQRHWREEM